MPVAHRRTWVTAYSYALSVIRLNCWILTVRSWHVAARTLNWAAALGLQIIGFACWARKRPFTRWDIRPGVGDPIDIAATAGQPDRVPAMCRIAQRLTVNMVTHGTLALVMTRIAADPEQDEQALQEGVRESPQLRQARELAPAGMGE